MAFKLLSWIFYFGILPALIKCSICHNNCHNNGLCNKWGFCECFKGYEGNDCARRICPKGPALADIAYDKDLAHAPITCSGKGTCDVTTGLCICSPGFYGLACETSSCINNCNNRGRCINLATAASENDGYRLNYTTTYSQWDANIIYGCVCDYGFSGPDCSERVCESGPDPRMSESTHEVITLVCDCQSGATCGGKFKLRFMGIPIKTFLYPASTIDDVINALYTAPGILTNSPVYVYSSLEPYNKTSSSQKVCNAGLTTRSQIYFKRNYGDIAPISFYANLVTPAGNLYFETLQTIQCDCTLRHCNGTFRLSFDGEMSPRIKSTTNGSEIISALRNMKTVQGSGFKIIGQAMGHPLCRNFEEGNFTIIMRGNSGNAPVLGLWSSVVLNREPDEFLSSNASSSMRILTYDGRDDSVKLCNGIGQCDFSSGVCTCPYGWGFDPDLGPCGALEIPTSRWGGVSRCPGVVAPNMVGVGRKTSLDNMPNYPTRFYLSMDPWTDGNYSSPHQNSAIYYFTWRAVTLRGAKIDPSTAVNFINMTSNSSAGPLVLDAALDRIFFVDANPSGSFIGFANQYSSDVNNYTVWIGYSSYKIFGLAFDAHYNRRNLYWTVPGKYEGVADGDIFWANVDTLHPSIRSLKAVLDQTHVFSPHGLAIHYADKRIYWVDRNESKGFYNSVLRSCDFDGRYYEQTAMFKKVGSQVISMNLTDLVIDFTNNATALMLDTTYPTSIIATNLNAPLRFDNDSNTYFENENYYTRVIVNYTNIPINNSKYIAIDENNFFVLWADLERSHIGYARYRSLSFDYFSPGVAYRGQIEEKGLSYFKAVGLLLDRGLGTPHFGEYVDCYGNGVCLGLAGKFQCKCSKGFYGDCQVTTCPTGKAWFSEPRADEIAHDEMMECSNVGTCDRVVGSCSCPDGYEGSACERSSCPKGEFFGEQCHGVGRCVSMRTLASYHKDEYLQPSPVVYGSTIDNPVTWDADRIYGCIPDEFGSDKPYDYSMTGELYNISSPLQQTLNTFECPVGFNKRLRDREYFNNAAQNYTTNFTNTQEVQMLTCNGWSGYFTLSFRGKTSRYIYGNSTSDELKRALEDIQTVGMISVDSSASTICNRFEKVFTTITFISHLGKVPLLEVGDTAALKTGRVKVTEVTKSTTLGLLECSGKGDCDTSTGLCKCWEGYGTSDGIGNPGSRGDCGHYLLT